MKLETEESEHTRPVANDRMADHSHGQQVETPVLDDDTSAPGNDAQTQAQQALSMGENAGNMESEPPYYEDIQGPEEGSREVEGEAESGGPKLQGSSKNDDDVVATRADIGRSPSITEQTVEASVERSQKSRRRPRQLQSPKGDDNDDLRERENQPAGRGSEQATARRTKRRKLQSENDDHVQSEHDDGGENEQQEEEEEAVSANRDGEDDRTSRQRSRKPKMQISATPTSGDAEESPEEPTAAPGAASTSKRRRGQKRKEKQQHEPEAEGQVQRRETKTKQPRGDTVPVTVHRFVNIAALDVGDDDEEEGEEEESADELSTRQKTTNKLPNRSGVNAADVLSQVCRESLEKTSTTLKNGIAGREASSAQRSEWTRKRKAVEAFGRELEGRLFELSDLLDSNFALGAQLRKSKREMSDLRNRLHQLRRERESVALDVDAVRRRHMTNEGARMVCTAPQVILFFFFFFFFFFFNAKILPPTVPQYYQQYSSPS